MMKNNSKKKVPTSSRPVSEKTLRYYINEVLTTVTETKKSVETRIDDTKKFLEARIEYSRKDAGEQIHGVQKAVNARIDNVVKELKEDIKLNHQAIKSVKEDVNELRSEMVGVESRLSDKIDSIGTRIDDHEAKPVNIAHRAV